MDEIYSDSDGVLKLEDIKGAFKLEVRNECGFTNRQIGYKVVADFALETFVILGNSLTAEEKYCIENLLPGHLNTCEHCREQYESYAAFLLPSEIFADLSDKKSFDEEKGYVM